MIRKTYYTENNNKANKIIQQIIEMRKEDKKNIETMLKDIILK